MSAAGIADALLCEDRERTISYASSLATTACMRLDTYHCPVNKTTDVKNSYTHSQQHDLKLPVFTSTLPVFAVSREM